MCGLCRDLSILNVARLLCVANQRLRGKYRYGYCDASVVLLLPV